MKGAVDKHDDLITADMLRDLPAPVQRYLSDSGVVGNPPLPCIQWRAVDNVPI